MNNNTLNTQICREERMTSSSPSLFCS